MNFSLFLTEANTTSFWTQASNICFRGDEFNPLFTNILFSHLEKNNLLPYAKSRLDLTITDKKTALATLNQSMLGNYAVFWLSNIAEGTEKSKQDLLAFIVNYQGPHHVIYFLPKDAKLPPGKNASIVEIPTHIDLLIFEQLVSFFKQNIPDKKNDLIKRIFRETKTLPIDTACMLINYLELINIKHVNELSGYLAYITQTQPSLNQLSEYFFTANVQSFFSLWATIEKEYPEMFWLSFWSEQFWKAHHVISYLKKNDFVNAKRMSFRLPYSFINTHWKRFTQQELKQLYNHLYLIDMKIKRGGSGDTALNFFFFSYFFEKSRLGNCTSIV